MAEHLYQVEDQTGIIPVELEGPPIPMEAQHIWAWFLELHQTRSMGMSGPLPISYNEIQAWSTLKDLHITSWEVDLLKMLDNLYLEGSQNGFSKTKYRN